MVDRRPDSGHLSAIALPTIAALLSPSDQSPEAQYLRGYSVPHPPVPTLADDQPLRKLERELHLTKIEVLATAIASAVETDLMCGRAIAHLQSPLGGSRPTLGLLAAALREHGEAPEIMSAILTGAGVESGLLRVMSENAPLAERPVSVPLPICLALNSHTSGHDGSTWPGTVIASGPTGDIPLPPSVLANAKKRAGGLASGVQKALVIRSGSLAEGKAIAAEIARRLELHALFIELDKSLPADALAGLGPWMILRRLMPVFCMEPGPGERKALPELPKYRGVNLAVCGPEGSVEFGGDTVPGWTIPVPLKAERIRLWELAVGSPTLARLLAPHRHSSGRISQLGKLARYQSAINGRTRPIQEDVVAASWTTEGGGLEALAQAISDSIPDEALVMTPGLRDELDRLLLRCRGREGLTEGLGASASAKYRPGVRALFTGPSGTGKTLAAGWLSTRLGLPLYRVDLAAVTSKYIGETEKNLAQLLARAESGEVILLFDEADSMFGKRTDVKESNDRFANAQTNYLLQRIERYDGIVFLTSNNRSRFDPAFFRRLDVIIDFPVPGPVERRSLWQSHLGPDHRLNPRELNQLSAAADLLGGNIRNAVLTGAMLARAEKRSIAWPDLVQALTDEYRKLGKQIPSDLQRTS